jgi:outer membrane protein
MMIKHRVCILTMSLLAIVVSATAAFGETNWLEQFLGRYRPSRVDLPLSPAERSQQAMTQMIHDGTLPLTIGDIISLMLENNLDIGVNRITPRSAQFLIETLGLPFEPTLQFGATVGRNTSPSSTQLSGASALSQLAHSYSVGFGQTLATGTNIGVNFSMNRLSSNSSFNTFNPAWTGLVTYSFNQHLMRNFGKPINTSPIRVAQNNQKISEVQFEQQLIDLVTQAQKAYWDFVFVAEDLKVKQRSLDLAQQTLAGNRRQVDLGSLSEIDVTRAEADVASRREQLIVTSYTQTQMEDHIKRLITNQADPRLVIARLTPTQGVRQPGINDVSDFDQAFKTALENRPEIRRQELDVLNKDIDLQFRKNQLRPVVDILGSYNQNGLGGVQTLRTDLNGSVTAVVPGGPGDAFSQLFGYGYTGYSVGFNVQIPLSNRAAQGDHARAVAEKRLSESRLGAIAQQIALDVRDALTLVEMNQARIEAARTTRAVTELELAGEQKKFELGVSTTRIVLEEQRNLAQAQTNEIQALVNYMKALVDFDHATGMVLKRNNVEIQKALNPVALVF